MIVFENIKKGGLANNIYVLKISFKTKANITTHQKKKTELFANKHNTNKEDKWSILELW
jgi:hypothetical protein